ncbi:uncharacterized protein RAG0_02681 [Rhynchosporium agropyri]|uniref:Uncharacterized protein n=1 Tax=Rhynchosporium agropyri TaxID=914238 RepID=A0A1E1K2B5_9HELO|nr:uncharacterized protein RAG0_02681 [Rhynchosporium agropyri]
MDQRKLSEAEILWEISVETFRVNVGEALAASTSVQDFISFIANFVSTTPSYQTPFYKLLQKYPTIPTTGAGELFGGFIFIKQR